VKWLQSPRSALAYFLRNGPGFPRAIGAIRGAWPRDGGTTRG